LERPVVMAMAMPTAISMAAIAKVIRIPAPTASGSAE
jgi:hypothetical protein